MKVVILGFVQSCCVQSLTAVAITSRIQGVPLFWCLDVVCDGLEKLSVELEGCVDYGALERYGVACGTTR